LYLKKHTVLTEGEHLVEKFEHSGCKRWRQVLSWQCKQEGGQIYKQKGNVLKLIAGTCRLLLTNFHTSIE